MIPETITTSDGLKLFVQHWPVENPKAAVMIAHGLGEHIGRYQHVAEALNQAGYAVVELDHRTHGKSEGQPRTAITNIDIFVKDMEPLWQHMEETYPGMPHFLLGHSMGGQIAVRFTLRNQDKIKALVTSEALLSASDAVPGFLIPIIKLLALIAPNLQVVAPVDSSLLSHHPDVPATYNNDPLVYHGKIRAGIAKAAIEGEQDALARAHTLKLPMLILHGEEDKVVLPVASQKLHDRVGSRDKTSIRYPGLYHEIFNERPEDREKILNTVIEWLDKHL